MEVLHDDSLGEAGGCDGSEEPESEPSDRYVFVGRGTASVGMSSSIESSRLIGESARTRRVAERIVSCASSDATVLIEGPSGTGKEVAARMLHRHSSRNSGPMIAFNCGGIAEGLLGAELFGSVRGAFTGAHRDRQGLFASADGGTLFLDEVGELPPSGQASLLRAIESRSVRPIGSDQEQSVDVRLVAATNQPLRLLVHEGKFRLDLYFRLNVLSVVMPALASIRSDIPHLASHFASSILADRERVAVSADAMRQLMLAPLCGNARELRNIVERTLAMRSGDTIWEFELGTGLGREPGDIGRPTSQSRQELCRSLARHGGRIDPAAKDLGVSTRTLNRWLKRYGLSSRDFRNE